MVVQELRGEKLDIVPFSDDPATFVANALSPAKVKEVRIDQREKTALVIVPDYQLSLAIGKEGQNARLAARLTGWRVDIKSESQFAQEQARRAAPQAEPAPEAEAAPSAEAAPEAEAPSAEAAPEAETAPAEAAPAEAASAEQAGAEVGTETAAGGQ